MAGKRLPQAGDRVRVGRRSLTLPGVPSMTGPEPVVPPAESAGAGPEKPADEPREELVRMIKAAYQ